MLVASTSALILLVARWLSTVWFGMFKTLLSSFIGVVPLSMDLPRNNGKPGGVGNSVTPRAARA